jgi:hypothetical protein
MSASGALPAGMISMSTGRNTKRWRAWGGIDPVGDKEKRRTGVWRERAYMAVEKLSVERGDSLAHDPVAVRMTIYREGAIVRTEVMSQIGWRGC